jgi:hypothetical protein
VWGVFEFVNNPQQFWVFLKLKKIKELPGFRFFWGKKPNWELKESSSSGYFNKGCVTHCGLAIYI